MARGRKPCCSNCVGRIRQCADPYRLLKRRHGLPVLLETRRYRAERAVQHRTQFGTVRSRSTRAQDDERALNRFVQLFGGSVSGLSEVLRCVWQCRGVGSRAGRQNYLETLNPSNERC